MNFLPKMDASGKRTWQGGGNTGSNKRHHPGADMDELIADAENADADVDGFGEDVDVRQEEEEDFELDLGEAGRNWERPPPPALRPSRDSIGAVATGAELLDSFELATVTALPLVAVQQISPRLWQATGAHQRLQHLLTCSAVGARCSSSQVRLYGLLLSVFSAVFQQLETDCLVSAPNKAVHQTDLHEVPVIRMFGVNEEGESALPAAGCEPAPAVILHPCCSNMAKTCRTVNPAHRPTSLVMWPGNSVCTFVHGFEPYFYIEAPMGFGPDDCEPLQSLLNVCHWECCTFLLCCYGMGLMVLNQSIKA